MEIIKFIVALLPHTLIKALLWIGLLYEGQIDEFYSLYSDRDPIEHYAPYLIRLPRWFIYEFNTKIKYFLVVSFKKVVLLHFYLDELLVVNVGLDLIVEEMDLSAAILDEFKHYLMELFCDLEVLANVFIIEV